ncbi:hypothetical protein ACJV45_00560 [Gardnerella sp. Marseille-Q9181]|uniref:hypothetical protein n=1 Tax=Gardnerella sp. Marseille-Q9181 TaxID=3383029 RepID=UPI003AF7BE0C
MSDKIKELSEKRDAAIAEMYKALFVKQNAAADYREKLETFAKIDEQLEQAKKEEANNDTRN